MSVGKFGGGSVGGLGGDVPDIAQSRQHEENRLKGWGSLNQT